MMFDRLAVLPVAERFVDLLAPYCERIAIAGSIRRNRPKVGDIEILFVPKVRVESVDFFATKEIPLTEAIFENLLATGEVSLRFGVSGSTAWGLKNKLGITKNGVPIDFFSTSIENWFVSLVIRTGSKRTNLSLTTGAQKLGRRLNAYGSGVTCSDYSVIPARSEEDVFKLCGVPYMDPEYR